MTEDSAMKDRPAEDAGWPPVPQPERDGLRTAVACVAAAAGLALGVAVLALLVAVNGGQLPRITVAITRPLPAGL